MEILRTVGRWVKRNSEAIYATDGVQMAELPTWGRMTQKPGKLFCHVLQRPQDGRLKIANLTTPISRAYLLADPGCRIEVTQNDRGTTLHLSGSEHDPMGQVICICLSKDAFPLNFGQVACDTISSHQFT